jgi:hypothetical protein
VGFLLAGVGHRTVEGQNFLIVKQGKVAPITEIEHVHSNCINCITPIVCCVYVVLLQKLRYLLSKRRLEL